MIALVVAGGLPPPSPPQPACCWHLLRRFHDLLKGILKPEISEQDELNASRVAMVGAIALAGYFGLNPPDFAAGTVAIAFGLAASSIFPVLMLGIFSKRMNRQGPLRAWSPASVSPCSMYSSTRASCLSQALRSWVAWRKIGSSASRPTPLVPWAHCELRGRIRRFQ